jgi:transposase
MSARTASRKQRSPGGGRLSQRSQLDDLRRRNEQLKRDYERLERDHETLRKELAERESAIVEREKKLTEAQKQIEEAQKRIEDLEGQLASRRQNSTNSSKPPSSDGLAGDPRDRGRKKKSKRRPGGQPGHPGAHRLLVPSERVTETHTVLPAQCGSCGLELPQQLDEARTEGEMRRYQVIELPPIQAHITEYQCHLVICPRCRKGTRADVPQDVRPTGPQLTALIAYLTVVCRMPRRVTMALLEQVLGIEISLGTIQQCWENVSAAVEQPCDQLRQQLPNEPVVNTDTTGWRNNGDKRCLHAFVAAAFVYYTVALTQGSEFLQQILGPVFAGILCSDRFSAYVKYHKGTAQFCWSHFKRNILGVLEFTKKTDVERFCRDALALQARLFRLWHKFRGGAIDRQALIDKALSIEKKFFALAEQHLDAADRQVRNLATAMFEHCPRWFTFIEHEGVEPTNNISERALRIAVQWRKVCFGNRSHAGEIATARLLTATQTCKLQGLNALLYLSQAVIAHRRHQPIPSLLNSAKKS